MSEKEPADIRFIVRALGGPSVVAARLGISTQAVVSMMNRNAVPPRHDCKLLQLCVGQGVYWRPPGWDSRILLRAAPAALTKVLRPLEDDNEADFGTAA